jgi:hypothetical protein
VREFRGRAQTRSIGEREHDGEFCPLGKGDTREQEGEGHEDDRVEDVYRAGVGGHGAGTLASTCPFCRRNLDDARLAPGSQAEALDVIEPADRMMDS